MNLIGILNLFVLIIIAQTIARPFNRKVLHLVFSGEIRLLNKLKMLLLIFIRVNHKVGMKNRWHRAVTGNEDVIKELERPSLWIT